MAAVLAAVPHPLRPCRVVPWLAGAVGGVRRGAGCLTCWRSSG